MEECIICFENIENNTSNIYLECCKNYVHDNCLQLWISTNIDKNKDINLCIYCKKNNINITKIINNYKKLLPNNNTEIIIINDEPGELSKNIFASRLNLNISLTIKRKEGFRKFNR